MKGTNSPTRNNGSEPESPQRNEKDHNNETTGGDRKR
jgi:hypothetical protein